MIANTQANPLVGLLGGVSPNLVAVTGSANNGTAQARFDLTLLEMTKHVVDQQAAAPEGAAVPEKVRKALESVLQTLTSQPVEQLNLLGKTADQLAIQSTAVAKAAEAFVLNEDQERQLGQLTSMAVQKISSSLQPVIAIPKDEVGTLATPVLNSGPFGGTTVSSTSSEIIPTQAAKPETSEETTKKLPQLAAQVAVPQLVSTRTVDVTATASDTTESQAISGISSSAVQNAVRPQGQAVSEPEASSDATAPKAAPQAPKAIVIAQAQEPVSNAAAAPVEVPQALQTQATDAKPAAPRPPLEGPVVEAPTQALPEIKTKELAVSAAKPNSPAPKAAETQLPYAPQIEFLDSQAPVVQIQKGSEITVAQVEAASVPVPEERVLPLAASSEPVAVMPQASPPAAQQAVLQAAAIPQSPQIQVAASSSSPVAVQEASADTVPSAQANAKAMTVSVGSEPDFVPSPVKRWLDEASARVATLEGNATQAIVPLNRESLKDLAASVAKEYSMRESVFSQSLEAIQQATEGSSQIRIHLKPESLGGLDVSLIVEGGKLTARLIASSQEVRDVFAANLPQFKAALEGQGLNVSQISVAVRAETSAQGQGQQSWQQPQAWQSQNIEGSATDSATPVWATMTATAAYSSNSFSALA